MLPTVVECGATRQTDRRHPPRQGLRTAGCCMPAEPSTAADKTVRYGSVSLAWARAAASAEAASAVAELVAWTDSRWASVPQRWAVPTQGLCPCRRLLLGLVLFGRLRYQVAAARPGLSAQMVSVLCLTALRQLHETTTRETEAQSAAATSVSMTDSDAVPGQM